MRAPRPYCKECYARKKNWLFEPDPRFSRKYPMKLIRWTLKEDTLICPECGTIQKVRRAEV